MNDLHWLNTPLHSQCASDDELAITAGTNTDWFIDPRGGVKKSDAPVALFTPPDQNFILQARVTVDFRSTFDAGVLFVYEDETHWAKLCFEYSPQGQPMIVSVVTRELSDDCNSVPIEGNSVYLRIHHKDNTWAFHYSRDARTWHMVRYFRLGANANPQIGFSAQSPTGQGCTAVFADIKYEERVIADIRNGE